MLALGRLLELTLAGREPQVSIDGTRLRWLAEGALEVAPAEGRDAGLDLLLSAGIHGNEVAPIELLDRLLRDLARGSLRPRARLLFLFGNPGAIRAGRRCLNHDLNRLFDGRHAEFGGPEAQRACRLERLVETFFARPGRTRLHYDLHSALRESRIEQFALYPCSTGRPPCRLELARLYQGGVQAVLLQEAVPGIFTSFTYSRLGAEAFTLEVGETGTGGRLERLELWLRQRIAASAPPADMRGLDRLRLFVVSQEIVKRSEGFRLNLARDILNFSELPVGYLLAEDAGGARWVVRERGTRIVFPDPGVPVGQRAGILVVPTRL